VESKPSDPWDTLLDLLQQLPSDQRRTVADALRQVVKPTTDVTGHVSVVQDDQTLEARGTVSPGTVALEGTVDIVVEMAGELTVTPGTSPELRRRQDRFIAMIVVVACFYAYLNFATQPFDEAVRELLGQAIEVLLFGFPRQ
jgi:hypothetical protein